MRIPFALALVLFPALVSASPSFDSATPASQSLPPALVDVGIDEHLGDHIPLDTRFLDEDGHEVRLSSYFGGSRPVLFNFAYFRCPMLCSLVLSGMVEGIKSMDWTPGKEFEVVTLSIDPKDGPEQAKAKKATHMEALGRNGSERGWHFLTGKREQVERVAKAIGFGYHYNPSSDDYSHPAAIFALSPTGKISRYFYGIQYSKNDLRLGLLEAKEEKTLSVGDKLLLFCYHYDPKAKGYVLFAQNLMRAGGALVAIVLVTLLCLLWAWEFRKRKRAANPAPV